MSVLKILLTLIFTISSVSQAKENYYEKLFTRAYVEDGIVTFTPHYKVSWDNFAPSYINNINIDSPTKQQLDLLIPLRDIYNNSEIEYEADIPSKVSKSLNCYLISPNGINELDVLRLVGTARFSMGDGHKNGPVDKIWNKVHYGQFFAEPAEPLETKEGGFSLCSKKSLEFEQSESTLSTDDVKKYFLSDTTLSNTVRRIENPEFWSIIKTYSFKIKGEKNWYRFFQLSPDNSCDYACCGKRYFVTNLDGHDLLSWNLYQCDV